MEIDEIQDRNNSKSVECCDDGFSSLETKRCDVGIDFVEDSTPIPRGSPSMPNIDSLNSVSNGSLTNTSCMPTDSDSLGRSSLLSLCEGRSSFGANISESILDNIVADPLCAIPNDTIIPDADNLDSPNGLDLSENSNFKMILQNYQSLQQRYILLQAEHQTLLGKEQEWCRDIHSNSISDDEAMLSLSQVNHELREQLQTVLDISKTDKACIKRLECDVNTIQEKNMILNDQLNSHFPKVDISFLEKENIALRTYELEAKEKLNAHDLAAKKTISALKTEMTIRMEELSDSSKELAIEKEDLDKALSELKVKTEDVEGKLSAANGIILENEKEIHFLKIGCKEKNERLLKLQVEMEEKEHTHTKIDRELQKKIEELDSLAMKVKWAQNKLRQELESHKDTKKQLTVANEKCNKMKEEASQVRQDCQEMIKKYQNSEEMTSIQLIQKLKDCSAIIATKEQEIAERHENQSKLTEELKCLKIEYNKSSIEVLNFNEKLSLANNEISKKCLVIATQEEKLTEYGILLQSLKSHVSEYEAIRNDLTCCKEKIAKYEENELSSKEHIADIENMLQSSRKNEAELLSFTEKLTENNASAQAQVSAVEAQLGQVSEDRAQITKDLEDLTMSSTDENNLLKKAIMNKTKENEQLQSQLNQALSSVDHLTSAVDDYKEELHLSKKKQSATTKDLQRQLQQTKRKIDQIESTNLNASQENLSIKSLTSSNSSLDKITSSYPEYSSSPIAGQVDTMAMEYSIVQPARQGKNSSSNGDSIDIDKNMLIDRICRLQKAHAKKNEKLDFLEEHVNTLVEELQKKTRIIQYYFGREDSGSLVTDQYDKNKIDISKRGGIMASLYSARSHDKDMTLDLSLQINTKLHTVLEDLILKNMTLKENIDTLSKEIERLQKKAAGNS